MLFLVEFSRTERRVVSLRKFEDRERPEADNCRLKLELELNRKHIDHEVVLLEAENEEALSRTHARYVKGGLEELAKAFGSEIENSKIAS